MGWRRCRGSRRCWSKPTNEALPGLLGAELDEGGAAEGEAEQVGHDVVDDHGHDRQDEPDQALGGGEFILR